MAQQKYKDFHTFVVKFDDAIAWLTFLPHVSVHSNDLLDDLSHLCDLLEDDECTKIVVFQSAHAEIFVCHAHTIFPGDATAPSRLQTVLHRLTQLPQVTVAKVEGAAHGGGYALALACDMRFATRGKATFAINYEDEQVKTGDRGVVCAGGSMARLGRLVGLGRALELALRTAPVDADLAEKYGLVNLTLEPSEISVFVTRLAASVARRPGRDVTACKRAVYASVDLCIEDALKEEACWVSGMGGGGQRAGKGLLANMRQHFGSPKALAEVPE